MSEGNGKKKRLSAAERDQDVLELQVMAKCKRWIEELRAGKARVRVASYLHEVMKSKEDQNTPRPPSPRQPELPQIEPVPPAEDPL